MTALLHPAADEEFAAAVRYYAQINRDLGLRFYGEIERLISDVRAHPERYRKFDPPAPAHQHRLSLCSDLSQRKGSTEFLFKSNNGIK